MTNQEIMNSHPAFRMKCLCKKHSHHFQITLKSTGDTYTDSICVVCAAQLEALGYTVKMVG